MLMVKNLNKNFGKTSILSNLNLTIPMGEMRVLCGPSGSGKSTLISCLAGLQGYESGKIVLNNKILNQGVSHPDIGIVFQSYALFSHCDVLSNIVMPLMLAKKMTRLDAKEKAVELLKTVGVDTMLDRGVNTLSGGQQQRVAIARALAMKPKILLLDEPSAALDWENTKKLAAILNELTRKGSTIIIASHDRAFIEALDCKVIKMPELP